MASTMQDTQCGGGPPSVQILEHDQRLCDACRTGDYNAAKNALEDGANPSVHFRLALGEITPIFLCASKGYKDIAELLIEHHADINRKMDFDGTICLHHAASNDQSEMCEFLISKGCSVNQRDNRARTPLMNAAEIGNIKVIDVLVNNNADVNAEDKEHHTALSYCIDFVSKKEPKFFDSAVRLVNHGANPNYAGKFTNRTLLHCAAAQGNLELVQQLVDVNRAALRVYDNEGKTPIKYAMEHRHQDVYNYLQKRLDNFDIFIPKKIEITAISNMFEPEKKQKKTTNIVKNKDIIEKAKGVLDSLYWIYYKHHVMGPYRKEDILDLYVTNKIQKTFWIKNIRQSKSQSEWCKVILSSTQSGNVNFELEKTFPEIYNYLIAMIESGEIDQYETPVDLPDCESQEIPMLSRILSTFGRMVAVLAMLFIWLHAVPSFASVLCCWTLPYYCCCEQNVNKLFSVTILIGYSGMVVIPFIIVYVVLLGEVNLDDWRDEIQSWMIAYIAWGIGSYLCTVAIVIEVITMRVKHHASHKVIGAMFWIIGVDFSSIDPLQLLTTNWVFAMAALFLFPSLAAVLPSAIIGFIANYALEEKFELKCNQDIHNDTLCFDDTYGCCRVISSHEFRNMYAFMGGLASNILATWAVIRICGYLMVNLSPEISMFAKRNK